MKVAIYQVIPELDRTRMLYNSLEFIKKVHNGIVPAEAYEMVFEGEVEAETTEDIFFVFNAKFPKGYKGRSLSVSDVVEIIGSDGKSEFYFCDSVGFAKIKFRKEKNSNTKYLITIWNYIGVLTHISILLYVKQQKIYSIN